MGSSTPSVPSVRTCPASHSAAGSSRELPSITQFLVDLSENGKSKPYLIPIPILTPIFAFKFWTSRETGRRQWDRIKLRLPMKIGPIVQKVALARFSRTMSSLIASGVPMMQAVKVTGDTSGNSVIEDAMDDIIRSIEEGRTFSEPLKRHPIFPSMVIQMAAIGENHRRAASALALPESREKSPNLRGLARLMKRRGHRHQPRSADSGDDHLTEIGTLAPGSLEGFAEPAIGVRKVMLDEIARMVGDQVLHDDHGAGRQQQRRAILEQVAERRKMLGDVQLMHA